MKGPDFGQGVNQWMAQKRAMMAAMAQMAAGIPPTGDTSNISPMDNDAIGGIATPELPSELGLPKPMGMAGSPPKMPPTGGNMAGQPLDIGALKGKITPEEIQMIMQIFQAKKMMGTKGFGGI
jgi:hypothetical protein